jgi:hypothetical protein
LARKYKVSAMVISHVIRNIGRYSRLL